jgi:tricorn protease-like protein
VRSVSDSITSVGISPAGGRAVVTARGEVFTVPREYGAIRNITRTPGARERNPAWSPDGEQLAFVSDRTGEYHVSNIYVATVGTGATSKLSSGLFNDFAPIFTRDGEHLLFVSNRRFDPTFCDFEWEMVYKDVAGIYALTLRRDGPPLLPLRSAMTQRM